ncbi:MAG: AbrB/MazE/SpoVT family DNA-binding domain-containing protein [Candidatus Nanoarchaeia archaeon]|nr:AbrB/MazE/SpoVT family DNA-binding domain-containing protein [Candidatus Nanoarchaeia archaeon]
MERKLIKQGGGGYTIYLPKKWVEKKNLKQGDFVKISETDNELIIGSDIKGEKDLTIDITKENEKNLKNILTHAYRKGFNKIKINSAKDYLINEIKKITNELLLGFEITEKTDEYCIIENISEPHEDKYEVILKKVFLIIKENQELMKDLKINFEEISEMKNNSDKFILFCRRLLIKEKYQKNIILEWEFLTFLMHISHAYYYLCKYAYENKVVFNSEAIKYLKALQNYYILLEDAYENKNINSIHKINELRLNYHFGPIQKSIEKSKGKNSVILSYIREIFRWIQLGTSPIYGIIFDKSNED